METISTSQAADMIRTSKGKIFSVTFIKRSTGSKRRMVGRTGVTQGVTGEGKAFNAADHDLLTVFELVTDPIREKGRVRNMGKQWRHVSIEGITSLRIAGKEFQVA